VSVVSIDPGIVAERSLEWLISSARITDEGLTWADTRSTNELNPMLYSGA
jgi:hypothetical protein